MRKIILVTIFGITSTICYPICDTSQSSKNIIIVPSFLAEKAQRLGQRLDIAQFAQSVREHNLEQDEYSGIAQWLEQQSQGGNRFEVARLEEIINGEKTQHEKMILLSDERQRYVADIDNQWGMKHVAYAAAISLGGTIIFVGAMGVAMGIAFARSSGQD